MNIFNIENAFTRMREKKWNYLTVAVDYHGTIAGASREPGKIGEIYPNAINVLTQFSDREDIKLVLDDKAGFVGETDWILIENELRRIGEWKEIA